MKKKHIVENVATKIGDFIAEMLDSKTDVRWEKEGASRIGFFKLDDSEYKIEIRSIDISEYDISIAGIKTFAFKFFRKDEDGSYSISLAKNNKYQFKVFGALKTVIEDFLDAEDPDILFFVGDQKRNGLYSKLLRLAEVGYSEKYMLRETKSGKEYLYFMIKLDLKKYAKNIESSKEILELLK